MAVGAGKVTFFRLKRGGGACAAFGGRKTMKIQGEKQAFPWDFYAFSPDALHPVRRHSRQPESQRYTPFLKPQQD